MQIRSGRMQNSSGLDELDLKIIEALRLNGRGSNQEIAERLSVTAATISVRLKRMEKARVMRVVAVTDFAAHDYNVLIAIGVKVQGRKIAAVARSLAQLPEVLSINMMHGGHDLELLVALRDFSEINVFLTDHVAHIEGIAALSPGIAADILKFEFNVAPL